MEQVKPDAERRHLASQEEREVYRAKNPAAETEEGRTDRKRIARLSDAGIGGARRRQSRHEKAGPGEELHRRTAAPSAPVNAKFDVDVVDSFRREAAATRVG